jgi:peptide/nickel transport system permease protein
VLFHYQGIGGLIYNAAKGKDFPMLESGILTIGLIYTVATLLADMLYAALNPRIHFGAGE